MLLIGDLAYDADNLINDRGPGTGNAILLCQSYAKVRGLKEKLPGLIIVPSHDPKASEML